jgi:hypothetical protein
VLLERLDDASPGGLEEALLSHKIGMRGCYDDYIECSIDFQALS